MNKSDINIEKMADNNINIKSFNLNFSMLTNFILLFIIVAFISQIVSIKFLVILILTILLFLIFYIFSNIKSILNIKDSIEKFFESLKKDDNPDVEDYSSDENVDKSDSNKME